MALPQRKLSPEEIARFIRAMAPEERETLEILLDKDLTKEVLRAIKEADEGKTVPAEKVFGKR